ncbi:MAG: RND family efflux transporter MFP subunit [Cyclobacteriaceae bacterium]|jgi:RND family efflux transporter MFP subunit
MTKIFNTIVGLALILAMTSCGSSEEKSIIEMPAIPVKVAKAIVDNNSTFITASGKIEAEKSASLSTRMMGYVTELYVNTGQKVMEGQLLVSINNTDLQAKKAQVEASIVQATAGYDNAKKDYDRFKTLFEQKSASPKELDDMTTRYEMAKAGLEAAQQMKNEVLAQFSYANIKAPFSGVVTNTYVKAGDMANPGMPLVSMEAPSSMQVMAMVSETHIDAIKNGMDVQVLVKSLDKMIKGKVIEISTSAKNTGGQYMVKINLNKTDDPVLSGMFVNVQFPVTRTSESTDAGIILIPEQALIRQGQLTGIYSIGAGNAAILRWLRTGKTYGDQTEVLSGLSADEIYVVSAEEKLFNGAKVSYK